ncbi:DUF2510 domain-containing protein [Pseudoclavibacter terrae]|uniref:DUF2510 domain-containing protein n=1 Tax=Pseudoclavibacter terrae TaxID=1530195 RepID=A0A7J5B1A6_9MICO|nr:DUF2510 domain-containing protein [Pseudoclavibacter terrae]KAB1637622.1 DUF2510 domain-containing protein [Pseudoclavibacter terrae]
MTLAPGWHPHPSRPDLQQWWDGKRWREATWPKKVGLQPLARYQPAWPRLDVSNTPQPRYDVVGEAYRAEEILAALGMNRPPVGREVERFMNAELIPEPDNPHSQSGLAISVRINDHVVGYISEEDAPLLAPHIHRVIASGYVPVTRARVWGATRQSRNGVRFNSAIRLAYSPTSAGEPINSPPGHPCVVLPRGRTLQVTGEEQYLHVLGEYLTLAPRTAVLVTLHRQDFLTKTGLERSVVEVRLDGETVGNLSPAMSKQLLPVIDHLFEAGNYWTAALGSLQGNSLSIELKLDVAKTETLTDEWIESPHRQPPQLVPVSTNYRVPPAFRRARTIEPAPQPKGIGCLAWVGILIGALLLAVFLAPFGSLLSMAIIVLGFAWSNYQKKQPPTLVGQHTPGTAD